MGKQVAVTIEDSERNTSDREAAITPRMAVKPPRRKLIILLIVLLVIMVVASTLLFVKYRHATTSSPSHKQQALTAQLGHLIEMPSGQPIISTVLDTSKLTNPALSKRAHNGDVLFIFPQSKRLILYRPADKKVVDMLNIE